MSKKANKARAKQLRSEAGAIRAAWIARGVAEGEFEAVKALEAAAAALDPCTPDTVDSLIK